MLSAGLRGGREPGTWTLVARWLTPVYVLVLAYVVLWPTAGTPTQSVSFLTRALADLGVPPGRGTRNVVEFVCNVLITAPVPVLGSGFAPAWTTRRWIALGCSGSVAVELYQLVVVVAGGRSATVRDVVANTGGVALGCLILAAGRRAWAPARSTYDALR